jgi:hypothetical protein
MEIVAWAVLVLIVFCVAVASAKPEDKPFKRRFPPISDAEFVARCTPGTDSALALRVRRFLADRLGVEYERIYPSTRFVDDLGLD